MSRALARLSAGEARAVLALGALAARARRAREVALGQATLLADLIEQVLDGLELPDGERAPAQAIVMELLRDEAARSHDPRAAIGATSPGETWFRTQAATITAMIDYLLDRLASTPLQREAAHALLADALREDAPPPTPS